MAIFGKYKMPQFASKAGPPHASLCKMHSAPPLRTPPNLCAIRYQAQLEGSGSSYSNQA